MGRRRTGIGLLLSALLLGACSSDRGVAEFALYREAFQRAHIASDIILDRLAVTERRLWRHCVDFDGLQASDGAGAGCQAFDPIGTPFRVEHAPYLIESGDPPATAAFRRAVVATASYTEALNRLTNGQSAEAVAGEVAQVAAMAVSAAAAVPAGPTAGLMASVAGINGALAGFEAPLAQGLGFVTRAEFRRQLAAEGDTMVRALDGVRAATPAMFRAFLAAEVISAPAGAGPDLEAVQEMRIVLASWSELLKASRLALVAAVTAAESEGPVTAASALATSQSLLKLSEEIRTAVAGARQ